MANLLDILYTAGLAASAPFWAWRGASRRKVLRALRERAGRGLPRRQGGPAVMIHAVSLGEINATRALVRQLAEARPELGFVISSTTDTGFARAQQLYGADPRVMLIRYPLDFSGAVDRVLEAGRPAAVVLMELEVWPNFLRACERRGAPVALVNGRLTDSSFRKYRLVAPVARRMFRRLAAVCAQDEIYARRFIDLGAPPEKVSVTGTMKFDTAEVGDRVEGDAELAVAVGLARSEGLGFRAQRSESPDLNPESRTLNPPPVWVCGSTGPGEEQIVLRVYERLKRDLPDLRLVIVPRKPERFDEAAELIRARGFALVRRSETVGGGQVAAGADAIILGDTMGELRKFYSLADVVFVGRTLVDLGPRQHGSDMIEPAALGKAVVVGPYTGNFADVMSHFRAAGAVREAVGEAELETTVRAFLTDTKLAGEMGRRGQAAVRRQQGATQRHVDVILRLVDGSRAC